MNWRIYYGDGSTFSEEDGTPAHAPGRNVQAIVLRYPSVEGQRIILQGFDYYTWDEGGIWDGWNGRDEGGLYDYLGEPGFKVVKQGRTIPDEKYHEILEAAINDPDIPLIFTEADAP